MRRFPSDESCRESNTPEAVADDARLACAQMRRSRKPLHAFQWVPVSPFITALIAQIPKIRPGGRPRLHLLENLLGSSLIGSSFFSVSSGSDLPIGAQYFPRSSFRAAPSPLRYAGPGFDRASGSPDSDCRLSSKMSGAVGAACAGRVGALFSRNMGFPGKRRRRGEQPGCQNPKAAKKKATKGMVGDHESFVLHKYYAIATALRRASIPSSACHSMRAAFSAASRAPSTASGCSASRLSSKLRQTRA